MMSIPILANVTAVNMIIIGFYYETLLCIFDNQIYLESYYKFSIWDMRVLWTKTSYMSLAFTEDISTCSCYSYVTIALYSTGTYMESL